MPQSDPNTVSAKPTACLRRATPGSAGLDLCASTDSILTPEDGVQIISTGIFGPPPPHTYYLILGRASSTLKGINVFPSLIDNDYTGEIKILASSTRGPLPITKGQRLAQALPLPLDLTAPALGPSRGPSTPGSSDIFWVQQMTQERPTLKLKLNGKIFEGLLDTGADSTVISQRAWPPSWPSQPTLTQLQGIGQSLNTLQSSQLLTWEDPEGNNGHVRPFIVPGLPVNLWGRDILSQMGVLMFSPSEVVTQQMLKQGFIPGKGLGKNNQGTPKPVSVVPKLTRTGLGYESHFS
ncbi:endogenous retrovirus group K member 7 Pro protein-like [Psammomys obesus]|uniref:endogenous retrovirus group K member 7 Pro protein-like n=1 Tax=Psammomys obesus TaxID=48139 RepID=UPI0024528D0B|nr:endogenous retrovirus group K member 7 Pro protein-like [Psammomys obesus]